MIRIIGVFAICLSFILISSVSKAEGITASESLNISSQNKGANPINAYGIGDDGLMYHYDGEGNGTLVTNLNVFVGNVGYSVDATSHPTKLNGFQTVDNAKYYFNNGAVQYANSKRIISGYGYSFDSNGKATTIKASSLVKIGNLYYGFASNGQVLKGGPHRLANGYYYYFYSTGGRVNTNPLKGAQKIGGYTYVFNAKGNGMYKSTFVKATNGRYYFLRSNGRAYTNLFYYVKSKKEYRYFGPNGDMYVGLKKIGNYYYYFNNSGYMYRKGSGTIGKNYYYFKTGALKNGAGRMYRNTWVKFKSGYRYYQNNGKAIKGLYKNAKGVYYYFSSKGYRYNNLIIDIKGNLYKFGKTGRGVKYALTNKKWIEVDISKQTIYLRKGSKAYKTWLCSTGRYGNDTPYGIFKIGIKSALSTYVGDGYTTPNVAWSSFFIGTSYAIHGCYWHSNWGHRMSHGCINLPNSKAKYVYQNWGSIGTMIWIHA
jgi:lipoprotein-anchoring transpeptidase ErfK/SrfK